MIEALLQIGPVCVTLWLVLLYRSDWSNQCKRTDTLMELLDTMASQANARLSANRDLVDLVMDRLSKEGNPKCSCSQGESASR